MDLIIDAKKLYPIKDNGFYKDSRLNSRQQMKTRLVVGYMRGHFNKWVNPIVVKDFTGGTSVKFKFGEMSKDASQGFEKYIKEVEYMNVWKLFENAMDEVEKYLKGNHGDEESVDEIVVVEMKEIATEWFRKELIEWDKKLEDDVKRAIKIGHGIKCKKKPEAYHFTDITLSNGVFEVLNMGKCSSRIQDTIQNQEEEVQRGPTKSITRLQVQSSEILSDICTVS